MKSIKKISFFGIICMVFLLVGCGSNASGKSLKCELKRDYNEVLFEIIFNEEGSKILNIKAEVSMEVGNQFSSEDINLYIESLKQSCEESGRQNCSIKQVENNIIVESFEMNNFDSVGYEENTIDGLKKELEEDGYTCKK